MINEDSKQKRSKFDTKFARDPDDFYRTFDTRAHRALAKRLPQGMGQGVKYAEPCFGYGDLVAGLAEFGHECVWASELSARAIPPASYMPECGMRFKNALELTADDVADADYIITNPPWDRKILHQLIPTFARLKPTWLLFEADWAHTKQSIPFMWYCTDIVSVGRMTWIEGTKAGGLKDCAWYAFDLKTTASHITFWPRVL